MDDQPDTLVDGGLLSHDDAQWQEARRRAAVIEPLTNLAAVPREVAEEAGRSLGISSRSVYSLLLTWRRTGGSVPMLAPAKPTGGRGKVRLNEKIEAIIASAIDRFYLKAQKPRVASVAKEVRRCCRTSGLKPPALNTVKERIDRVRPDRALAKREGSKAALRLKPAPGVTPPAVAPLDTIQIDHTKIDVIVVDQASRLPIGRPHLTVAIDEFSRCIVGMCITLEAPSATSVGLCLSQVATDKSEWLKRLDVDCVWPMHGKPKRIYVDNGADFHSEALRRGCEVHGIKLDHRPVARPHYGGIGERVIGTAMRMIHELPGTTFSNIQQRGNYNSDDKAALTLVELEKWVTLAICGPYHSEWHSTLQQSPTAKWAAGIAQFGEPKQAQNAIAFLIDFLPVVNRQVQRRGFVIDRIAYYASALSPWIAARDRGQQFLIRTDPRDLSRIWVLDPKRNIYVEVPYRTLSNPPITKWEHRAALARLREQGREEIDETAIFKAVEQMRTIVDTATKETRAARRNKSRRAHLPAELPTPPPPPHEPVASSQDVPRPFADIEEW
jgi:putative transposase